LGRVFHCRTHEKGASRAPCFQSIALPSGGHCNWRTRLGAVRKFLSQMGVAFAGLGRNRSNGEGTFLSRATKIITQVRFHGSLPPDCDSNMRL
jgi:hypothetical protein